MNEQLQELARMTLKNELARCSNDEQLIFKKMYAHKNLEVDIDTAVDEMSETKLETAMDQVRRTLAKKSE